MAVLFPPFFLCVCVSVCVRGCFFLIKSQYLPVDIINIAERILHIKYKYLLMIPNRIFQDQSATRFIKLEQMQSTVKHSSQMNDLQI